MSKGPHLSDDRIADVLERMADDATTLKEACFVEKLHYGNIRRRIALSDDLNALYTRARQEYVEDKVQRMELISLTEPDVARARLRCDNIKWEAARVIPKQYGDRMTTEVTGPDGGPVRFARIERVIVDPAIE